MTLRIHVNLINLIEKIFSNLILKNHQRRKIRTIIEKPNAGKSLKCGNPIKLWCCPNQKLLKIVMQLADLLEPCVNRDSSKWFSNTSCGPSLERWSIARLCRTTARALIEQSALHSPVIQHHFDTVSVNFES